MTPRQLIDKHLSSLQAGGPMPSHLSAEHQQVMTAIRIELTELNPLIGFAPKQQIRTRLRELGVLCDALKASMQAERERAIASDSGTRLS
jgi:hypothetical protein